MYLCRCGAYRVVEGYYDRPFAEQPYMKTIDDELHAELKKKFKIIKTVKKEAEKEATKIDTNVGVPEPGQTGRT